MFTFDQVAIVVSVLFGGSGIVGWLTVRQRLGKMKADTSAVVVDTLAKVLDELREELDRLTQKLEAKQQLYERAMRQQGELEQALRVALDENAELLANIARLRSQLAHARRLLRRHGIATDSDSQ